jgi:hypothetical protein
MLHPALARALAGAHIDDLHRAAARRHTIRLTRRDAPERRSAEPYPRPRPSLTVRLDVPEGED